MDLKGNSMRCYIMFMVLTLGTHRGVPTRGDTETIELITREARSSTGKASTDCG